MSAYGKKSNGSEYENIRIEECTISVIRESGIFFENSLRIHRRSRVEQISVVVGLICINIVHELLDVLNANEY